MSRSRAELGPHFNPLTARIIDALIEGIGIHNSVDGDPLDRQQVASILQRLTIA